MTDFTADSTQTITASKSGAVKWAAHADSTLAVTVTRSGVVPTFGADVTLTVTTSRPDAVKAAFKANSPQVITANRPTVYSLASDINAALAVTTDVPATPYRASGVDSVLEVDTAAWVVFSQTFTNYADPDLIADMPNTFCIGSGRRFRGSIFKQGSIAYCPHCKTTSNYLGVAAIPSEVAADAKFVVPDHVEPDLVAATMQDVNVFVSVNFTAQMTWNAVADVALQVIATPTVNRQVPDKTADATLSITATQAAAGLWNTSADATLPVTTTSPAAIKWAAHGDAALLTKSTIATDGPDKWRVDCGMAIIASPIG